MKEFDPRIIKMNIARFEAMLMLKLENTKRAAIEGLLLETRRDLPSTAAAAHPAQKQERPLGRSAPNFDPAHSALGGNGAQGRS